MLAERLYRLNSLQLFKYLIDQSKQLITNTDYLSSPIIISFVSDLYDGFDRSIMFPAGSMFHAYTNPNLSI